MPTPSRLLSRRAILLGAAVAVLPVAGRAAPPPGWRLMMVESPACHHCRAWHAQIGPGYAASRAGRAAPLIHVDVDGPYPDGLALDRRPWITPTFVLLSDGFERGRVEGYVGARHFHPVLEAMMREAGLSLPGAPG
ncbi:MAG: SoxS protein [Paracoccus sp.]|nr:SoxS protein [Paracoccus sp. (in: a-proteobacteria)]